MTTLLAWRKSSYSGGGNGGCVEVAAAWRKSSYSAASTGGCVQTAALTAGMAVRDSKDPDGPTLGTFSFTDWSGFVSAVRAGTFRA